MMIKISADQDGGRVPTPIIFLHGASSSGKSTLARALQQALPLPFWHISIDHLRDSGMLPTVRFERGDFDWQQEKLRFFSGYHHSLTAYAAAGNPLILEHILEEGGWFEMLVRLFAPFDVFFVGLHCPPELLMERETLRGDRPVGSALADYRRIHQGLTYDLELSALSDLEDNVAKVLQAWGSRTSTSPSVFALAYQELMAQE